MIKLFNWKYQHFKNKLRDVERAILDLQFKRFKTREIREEIRTVYDLNQSKLVALTQQIESEKKSPTLPEGDIKRLDDQKVLLERDIERFKKQLQALDIEVNGTQPTNEYPDGFQGINQQLDSFEELKLMIRDYMNKL